MSGPVRHETLAVPYSVPGAQHQVFLMNPSTVMKTGPPERIIRVPIPTAIRPYPVPVGKAGGARCTGLSRGALSG